MTNFDSAHDKDESMTIDYHFDEEGDFIGHMSDSVWYVFPFSLRCIRNHQKVVLL